MAVEQGKLWETLDRAQGELFDGRELEASNRERLISRLLEAQIPSGRGAGLFDPGTGGGAPMRLFTGEPLRTRLAAFYVFSQESARMIHRLAGADPAVQRALRTVSERLGQTCFALKHCTVGECASSFVGYIRFLHSVEGERASSELAWCLQTLSQHRTREGRWRGLPFYYTLLVLLELDGPAARTELALAEPACMRAHRHGGSSAVIAGRRNRVLDAAIRCAQESRR